MYSHVRGGHASGGQPAPQGGYASGYRPGATAPGAHAPLGVDPDHHRPIGLAGDRAAAGRTMQPVAQAAPSTPPAPVAEPSAGGMTALAVDDEEPALLELAHLLGEDPRVGNVLTAPNATEALRILHGNPSDGSAPVRIDVVFLDIRMPGLDGLELARVLNAMANPPPVVFVTAHDDRAVDAYEVGAVDYLLKPLRSERLAGALDRTIAHRAGRGAPAPVPPRGVGARARRRGRRRGARAADRRRGHPGRAGRHHEDHPAVVDPLRRGPGRLRPPAHDRGQPPRPDPGLGARGPVGRGRVRPDPPGLPRRPAPDHRAADVRVRVRRAPRPGTDRRRAAGQPPAHGRV